MSPAGNIPQLRTTGLKAEHAQAHGRAMAHQGWGTTGSLRWRVDGYSSGDDGRWSQRVSRSQITVASEPTVRFGLFLEDKGEPLEHFKQGLARIILGFQKYRAGSKLA